MGYPDKRTFFSIFSVVCTLLTTSCLLDPEAPSLPQAAYVSIYQGAPDAPDLDIYANPNRVNSQPLKYTDILAYSAFYPGNRTFQITGYNSPAALLEKRYRLEADSVYSLYVFQRNENLDLLMVKDNWKKPSREKFQLRIVNLSEDAGELFLKSEGSSEPLLTKTSFGLSSEFIQLPADTYRFQITSQEGKALVASGSLDLKSMKIYTLIIRGKRGNLSDEKKLDVQLVTNYIYP